MRKDNKDPPAVQSYCISQNLLSHWDAPSDSFTFHLPYVGVINMSPFQTVDPTHGSSVELCMCSNPNTILC